MPSWPPLRKRDSTGVVSAVSPAMALSPSRNRVRKDYARCTAHGRHQLSADFYQCYHLPKAINFTSFWQAILKASKLAFCEKLFDTNLAIGFVGTWF